MNEGGAIELPDQQKPEMKKKKTNRKKETKNKFRLFPSTVHFQTLYFESTLEIEFYLF